MRYCFILMGILFQSSLMGTLFVPPATQTTISSGVNNISPQVVVNKEGDAIAAWNNSTSGQIFLSAFNAITGWTIPTIVPTPRGLGSPQIGIDQSGNGIAVWVNPSDQIQVALYNAATSIWTLIPGFNQTPFGVGDSPQIGMDQKGNINADNVPIAWVNSHGNQILSAVFNLPTSTLISTQTVSTVNQARSVYTLTLLANNQGDVVGIWTAFPYQIFGATFNGSSGLILSPAFLTWSAVTQITNNGILGSLNNASQGDFPSIGVDDMGFGIVLFQDFNSGGTIQARRFPIP